MSGNVKILSLRMNTEDYNYYANLAKKDELPTSYVIRKVLKEYVKAHNLSKNDIQDITIDTPQDTQEDNVLNDWD